MLRGTCLKFQNPAFLIISFSFHDAVYALYHKNTRIGLLLILTFFAMRVADCYITAKVVFDGLYNSICDNQEIHPTLPFYGYEYPYGIHKNFNVSHICVSILPQFDCGNRSHWTWGAHCWKVAVVSARNTDCTSCHARWSLGFGCPLW